MANRRATSSHERSDLIDDGGEFVRYRAYRLEEHVSVKAQPCGPKSAVLKQTNQNFKPKSQTVKPKLQKTASFPCFSAIWFKVSGFWVKPSNRIVKPNAKAQTELVKF
jgi:hypothetical protein